MHDRVLHGDMDEEGNLVDHYFWDEICPRCNAVMAWFHSSPQCLKCRYKPGCCGD